MPDTFISRNFHENLWSGPLRLLRFFSFFVSPDLGTNESWTQRHGFTQTKSAAAFHSGVWIKLLHLLSVRGRSWRKLHVNQIITYCMCSQGGPGPYVVARCVLGAPVRVCWQQLQDDEWTSALRYCYSWRTRMQEWGVFAKTANLRV